jgi:hypothetical protein
MMFPPWYITIPIPAWVYHYTYTPMDILLYLYPHGYITIPIPLVYTVIPIFLWVYYYTLRKKGILSLSETLLGFPSKGEQADFCTSCTSWYFSVLLCTFVLRKYRSPLVPPCFQVIRKPFLGVSESSETLKEFSIVTNTEFFLECIPIPR